jgi:hypothetical protein
MKRILSQWGSRRKWTTLLLLSVGLGSLVAALLVGVADNPPGLALCYLSVTGLLLALTNPWRAPGRFLALLALSVLGFPVAVILHNLFYALSELASEFVGLARLLALLDGAFFIFAVLVCPPGALLGALGAATTAILRARQT